MIESGVIPAFLRAIVIGLFGGAALVLTQIYSRRGPMIFPVYAAILICLTLSLSRAQLRFIDGFIVTFIAIMLATAVSFVATLILAARARQRLRASGRELQPGHAPRWAFPLLLLILVTVSAGAAYVAS
jgi:hypothetical protein